jgi:hypothetical protein
MTRYEVWLQLLNQRDRVMVDLFLLVVMALAYYLLLVRGSRLWGRVALIGGVIAFYGSFLALYLVN